MPALLDQIVAVADNLRARMLAVLAEQELTVSELCHVLQLPQSTVSRHLKTLGRRRLGGAPRREGTSRYYSMPPTASTRRAAVCGCSSASRWRRPPAPCRTNARLQERARRAPLEVRGFFSSAAGQWDRLRAELFGACSPPATRCWRCSTTTGSSATSAAAPGQVSEALAPFVRQVDRGGRLEPRCCRRRARGCSDIANVDVRRGDARSAADLDDGELDAAVLVLVLHHVPEPGARARRSGARAAAGRPSARSSTCCRTTTRSTGSRWATSGWDSPTARCARCCTAAGFERSCACSRCRLEPGVQGPGVVRRHRPETGSRSNWSAPVRKTRTQGVAITPDPSSAEERRDEHCHVANPRVRRRRQGRPRPVQGQGPRRWPSGAARRSASPSTRCPA